MGKGIRFSNASHGDIGHDVFIHVGEQTQLRENALQPSIPVKCDLASKHSARQGGDRLRLPARDNQIRQMGLSENPRLWKQTRKSTRRHVGGFPNACTRRSTSAGGSTTVSRWPSTARTAS